jgi:hypothetical protein
MALGAVAVLSSCVHSGICPAIGWPSSIEINLSGSTDVVDKVRLCVDEACTMEPPATDEPLVVIESLDPRDFSTFTPSPEVIPSEFGSYADQIDQNTWSIPMVTGDGKDVRVQALSADGAVLAEIATDLEFVRVGGTEQCGGPTRAEVELEIPA